MWYTVWRKLNDTTYKFYMAAEHSTAAVSSAPKDAIITKTDFQFNTNYMHPDDLARYERVHWLPAPTE